MSAAPVRRARKGCLVAGTPCAGFIAQVIAQAFAPALTPACGAYEPPPRTQARNSGLLV